MSPRNLSLINTQRNDSKPKDEKRLTKALENELEKKEEQLSQLSLQLIMAWSGEMDGQTNRHTGIARQID